MNVRTLVPLAILLVAINLQAQPPELAQKPDSTQLPPATQQTASTQPPDSAQSREMERWIDAKQTPERVKRLVSLGVDKKTAESFTSEDDLEFKNFKNVEWKPIRAGERQRNAILFLPCVLDDAYLYLLVFENNSWRVTDRAVMDCHYDMSVSVEIAPIRNPAVDEVLVHHVCEGHGTGYSQQDLEVYSVARGMFKQVLDTEEVILAMQYVDPNTAMNEIHQRSLFVLVPIEKSRSRVIEETQSYQFNNKLTVKRRQFRWNAAKGRYIPSKFVPVVAASN